MLESEIADFISSLLLEKGMSGNTCEAYGRDLRIFDAYLVRRRVADVAAVTREDIVAFLADEREKGMTGSTRARRTAAIRMFFRYLRERRAFSRRTR